jgi:hypothetical protein
MSFATSAHNGFQLSRGPLRTRPGYTQVSMFQHSPFCTSVTTGTALSEDKKTGRKIIHLLSRPRHIKLFSNFSSQKLWPVIALFSLT